MKRRSSSMPAQSLFRGNPLFRNDPATRRTERAILRPIGLKAFGSTDEDPLFVFKYYQDTVSGPPSGERVMFISLKELEEFSGKRPSGIVDVNALSMLVLLDEFLEEEGGADMDEELSREIARQRQR